MRQPNMQHGLVFALLAATLLLTACGGDDGPTGPQGPAGIANVISGRDTLTEADWSDNTINTSYQNGPYSGIFTARARYADVAVLEITADVFDQGAVLLWMTVDSSRSYFTPLPYVFVRNGFSDYTWRYDAQVQEGSIRFLFMYERMDMDTSLPDPLAAEQADRIFRWMILPPGTSELAASLPLKDGPDATLAALADQGIEIGSDR